VIGLKHGRRVNVEDGESGDGTGLHANVRVQGKEGGRRVGNVVEVIEAGWGEGTREAGTREEELLARLGREAGTGRARE